MDEPRILTVGFEWPVCLAGYTSFAAAETKKKTAARALLDKDALGRLEPASPRFEYRRPLDIAPRLFLQFASLKPSPESITAFANAFGLLDTKHDGTNGDTPHEYLPFWYEQIRKLKTALRAWEMHRHVPYGEPISNVSISFSLSGDRDRPVLIMAPPTLLAAIWLQFAQFVTMGRQISACRHCGSWFVVGAPDGRRVGSQFCSEQHKIDFHNAKRMK